jgi:hypothetical protein
VPCFNFLHFLAGILGQKINKAVDRRGRKITTESGIHMNQHDEQNLQMMASF